MISHKNLVKNLLLALCLFSYITCTATTEQAEANQPIQLTHPMLASFDNSGFFNAPFVLIKQVCHEITQLMKGEFAFKGALVRLPVQNSSLVLESYMLRVELLFGASFISLSPEHPYALDLTLAANKESVQDYIQKASTKKMLSRMLDTTAEHVFTGSYAVNPINGKLLPVYISDYNLASFDTRSLHTHIGVPAHHTGDFAFAKAENLPILLVISVPEKLKGALEPNTPVIASPVIKDGVLQEAFIGKYEKAFIYNSDFLNDMSLPLAHEAAIAYLQKNNAGFRHEELLTYMVAGQKYSIQQLMKLESSFNKGTALVNGNIEGALNVALQSAQADFIVIVETFMSNVKKIKFILNALIKDFAVKRNNPSSYLLEWGKDSSGVDERTKFQKDIVTFKSFGFFCKDLLTFLKDLMFSCPKANYHATQILTQRTE